MIKTPFSPHIINRIFQQRSKYIEEDVGSKNPLGESSMILGNSKQEKKEVDIKHHLEDELPAPPPVEFRQPERVSEPRAVAPTAIIGAKITFKGELVGEEDLLIEGTVEGTVDLKGNALIIGKQGVVKANVIAKTVVVEGRVEGDVFGEERISIKESSHMTGNLIAERVTLEDGAKFKGSIDMDMEARKDDFKSFDRSSSKVNGKIEKDS